jgi:peroxiredoxin
VRSVWRIYNVRFRLPSVFAVLFVLVLAGCIPPTTESVTNSEPSPAAPPVGLDIGNRAPDLALQDLSGETVRLSDYAGQPVMINFWAVWCGFCRVELPEMQSVYESYQDQGFAILAVDVQEEASHVADFAEELGLTFPILLDTQGEGTRSYRIRGLPTSYFVDRNGVIIGKQVGPVDEAWMKRYLAQTGVE